jgi:hypothetical protein
LIFKKKEGGNVKKNPGNDGQPSSRKKPSRGRIVVQKF